MVTFDQVFFCLHKLLGAAASSEAKPLEDADADEGFENFAEDDAGENLAIELVDGSDGGPGVGLKPDCMPGCLAKCRGKGKDEETCGRFCATVICKSRGGSEN